MVTIPQTEISADFIAQPTQRVVCLGASNLARCLGPLWSTMHAIHDQPLDVMMAMGHGRSYGSKSHFLAQARSLPGISDCDLWTELSQRDALPTTALVTDIGNDLLYGYSPEEIASWVEQCLDRLDKINARCAVTRLPVENLDQLSPWWFWCMRTLMFPGCRITSQELRAAATKVNELLEGICDRQNCTLLAHRLDWYGIDPLHIRRKHAALAYQEWLNAWGKTSEQKYRPLSSIEWLHLRTRLPKQYWLLGRPLKCEQPTAVFADGTRLSMF